MAELKNQHYVPKVHLRAFSDDPSPKPRMINLINVHAEKAIKGAALSSQCSKNYFYGKDLEREKALSELEGLYADLTRRVRAGDATSGVLQALLPWVYLQHLRTDAARRRFKFFHDQLNDAVGAKEWQVSLSHDDLVTTAMDSFFESRHYVADLRPALIENQSSHSFVTSDAPAIVFNKWMSQRRGLDTFGITTSGVCLYMPLTPQHAFLAYDANVYDVSQNGQRVALKSEKEVSLINSLLMRADAINLYFRDWDTREQLIEQVVKEKPFRTPPSRTTIMVPIDGSLNRFRPLRIDEDEKDFAKTLLHTESIFPRPSEWFGFLRNKHRPTIYDEGTGAGPVRKREWLSSDAQRHRPPAKIQKSVLPGLPGNPFRYR